MKAWEQYLRRFLKLWYNNDTFLRLKIFSSHDLSSNFGYQRWVHVISCKTSTASFARYQRNNSELEDNTYHGLFST